MIRNTPFFSVIIAVYNNARGLERSIGSMLQQEFSDHELIVIDGGSTDGTQEIIKKYENHIAYSVSEKDSGIYNAWNKGIRQVRGEWICFLGCDDILYPDTLRNYHQFIKTNDRVKFVSAKIDLARDQNVFRTVGLPWAWPRFLNFMTIAHVGSMHHRSLFEKYGLFDETYKMAGDYEFLLRPRGDLEAGYMPLKTARMEYGGVSNSSMKIFKEVFRAKTQTGGKSLWRAILEDWLIKFKFQIRVMLGK